MKIKIIQADTRPLKIFLESRDLKYGPPDQMNFNLIGQLNNNILVQPNDSISIARCINLIKSKLLGLEYEFILGNVDDWESEGKKAHCWIKIHSLMAQMKNLDNKDIDLFCYIDSDAWIRDDHGFVEFCETFLKTPFHLACPRDIELPGNSFLNSGFLCVKNTPAAYHILDTIYNHPDFREYDKKSWHEQTELSRYYDAHPQEILVLPLNEFNTPCGRIIRHCWVKHLIEPLVIEEAISCMTRLAASFTDGSKYKLGPNILVFPSS